MLQPLQHIQYTATAKITVITTVMAIKILILIITILYNKEINADDKVLQQL